MSKKEVVSNRQYTDEFKVEAVRLGDSIGGNQPPSDWAFRNRVCGTGYDSVAQASSRRPTEWRHR
jgi:hypothetical protein